LSEPGTTTFLHLSDLHLGDDIVARSLWKLRSWKKHVRPEITDGLAAAINQLKPDYIILSGDFVNKPESETFLFASAYLRDLFLKTSFDFRNRVFAVPGNHDVSFFPKAQSIDIERVFPYRRFLCHLYGETDIEVYRHHFIRVLNEERIILICLDSTLKDAPPLAEGQIGRRQLDWVRSELKQIEAQLKNDYSHFAKIAVLHHHCKGIADTPIKHDRLMQLLDAEDVLKLFAEVGVNVVLHGHRHVPRITPEIRSDSSWMTIVGAGTATCVFPEEQHGHGNNFNLIRVTPRFNQLSVTLYRAGETGSFQPVKDPDLFPLFKLHAQGYASQSTRKVVRLTEDGIKHCEVHRLGIRVEAPGKVMNSVPLQILTDVKGSKIINFQYDNTHVVDKIPVPTDMVIIGELVFRKPLTIASQPADLSYSFSIKDGTAMSQADAAKFNVTEGESTSVVVTHPMETLKIEVLFPRGYQTKVTFVLMHVGAEVAPGKIVVRDQLDKASNIYTLELNEPPLDHEVLVRWTLPPTWP
jgi:3',5'-cyclic AMP phosphodiesterase CpdA